MIQFILSIIPLAAYLVPPILIAGLSCAEIATGAVGMIVDAVQAEDILQNNCADVVFVARELLRHPNWPLHAALHLGHDIKWPPQYDRAKPYPPYGSSLFVGELKDQGLYGKSPN